jgi:hypothetical protein
MSAALLIGGLVAAAPAFAGGATGNDFHFNSSTYSNAVGSHITVSVVSNTTTSTISGASAAFTFDKSKLQVTSITAGADWTGAGASAVGWNPASTATQISYDNANGVVGANSTGAAFGYSFLDGTSNLATGDHVLYTVDFLVGGVNCDVSSLTFAASSGLLSGDVGSYGNALSITTTGASVNNPCPTPTPAPTVTPVPTPTPTLAPANGQINVTGSVDAGFLSLQCPSSEAIPLVRNNNNVKDFSCTIYSNIIWSLQVTDSKAPTAPVGHMTSGGNSLSSSMHVQDGPSGTHNIDLATGGTVVPSGSNSVVQALELQQFVAPADAPGAYSISLTFQAVSGF